MVRFVKGERKVEVMRPYLERLQRQGRTGLAAIRVAQEFWRVFTGTTHTRPGGEPFVSQDTSIEGREVEASRRLAGALDPSVIDALLADAKSTGTPLDGVDGLLNQMTKAVLERALQAGITHDLGDERDDPAGVGTGNS